ncbi:response regulator [Gillisia sp. M10.2A]|uniref:Response regulator n=1 Tax=Gillisia lutea TaxID=2909668 RepID=A0ABS9EI41_9FLAO|nr:response regulator [Gillisia lutea]MCF4101116.1 response regulator [Gillisia lutea]
MKTILIIEDDTALRENIAELLELENYKVLTASNGITGIEKAKSAIPDLIICDIMMPEVDGYGVLETLTQNDDTNRIPFIFLSAKTEHSEIRKGMNLGADDYLTKPFEEEELLIAIKSRLAKSDIITQSFSQHPHGSGYNKETLLLKNIDELKNHFYDHGELYDYKKGELIYKDGEHSNKIFLIIKGVVKCHKMDENGKELITELHKADDFLGFTSFIDTLPYQESATAVTKVQLAGILKQDVMEVLSKNQHVSLELINILATNISEVKVQLLQMAYSSVRKKTAQTILHFAETLNKGVEETIKISRKDLASEAGIATESLIRTLSGFKKEGIVKTEGCTIKILNVNKLRSIE